MNQRFSVDLTQHRLDIDKLLSSGAIEGPARPIRPLTLTWRTRFVRWVRSWSKA